MMDTTETSCITSSALSTHDHPTIVDREKSEVSSAEVSPGVEGEEALCEKKEESEERREGEVNEEVEEDIAKWGPLKVPVTLKIADLGNACWVVRLFRCFACSMSPYLPPTPPPPLSPSLPPPRFSIPSASIE